MKELYAVVSVICASALICSLVSAFVTDGSTKKILNLILGAFIVCCMIIPVRNAIQSVNINLSQYETAQNITSTDDEAYSKAVLNQTKANLQQSLSDLLEQNNIIINRCEIILSQSDKNSIIISSISIYINNDYLDCTDTISNITFNNFGVTPSIMTE